MTVWTKPVPHSAVQWKGTNYAEVETFIRGFVEGDVSCRLVDGKLQYINDFSFEPDDIFDAEEKAAMAYTVKEGWWLVREYDVQVEAEYIMGYSPEDFKHVYVTELP
jgi:hypothetical protein